MSAALRMMCADQAAARHVALLGDMEELGAAAAACHRTVGADAAGIGIDLLLAVGDHAEDVAAGARDGGMPRESVRCIARDEVPEELDRALMPGDLVLVKASRRSRLEDSIAAWRAAITAARQDVRA